jgi:diketogulonate reductase-like aldo/keto reductase
VALRAGYRGIDTASLYANEEGVAEGLHASGVPRDEVFLTTKVWNTEQGYRGTLEALDRSLSKLGTDYVDLYLVHWPIEEHLHSTWQAMEEIYDAGKARAIGVCNHLPHQLTELMADASVAPMVDQVEFHPRLQQPGLQAFLAEHDIALEAWAPIMRGAVDQIPELVEIASAHGKSPAQVSIRWILQMGYVAIPKSVHEDRIIENCDVFDFELTDEEMEAIDSLDQGHRIGGDPDTYAW